MARMAPVVMGRRVRDRLAVVVHDLYARAIQVRQEEAAPDSPGMKVAIKHTWQGLLEIPTFTMGLAASEAQAYTSLYFGYEHFLGQVVEVATGDWPETTGEVGDGIKTAFGDRLYASCWTDRQVEAARHARDAFAHRGGRTQSHDVLGKGGKVRRKATSHYADLLHVEGDTIRVAAFHTRDLYAVLFDRVLQIVAAQRQTESDSAAGA